jgi:putative SOS response-associated peptidase YedK
MCGRFALTNTDAETLTATFELGSAPDLAPRYNIAPTQNVATVVRDTTGTNMLRLMRWGLIPSWAKDKAIGSRMINARGETVHEKPSFRAALRHRRCLVIADGFYEWQTQDGGAKQPMFITLANRDLFGMAGLYEHWTDQETGEAITSCTIITTNANPFMKQYHDRMPVILPREQYAFWLDPGVTDAEMARALLMPYPADLMDAYPVSRVVNSPANDDPSLIERAG